MQTIKLYRHTRPDGGVTVSTVKPESGDVTELYRLIANEGYLLTDGTSTTPCVDTDTPDAWAEVADPEAVEEKAAAYDVLMGVTE